MRYVKNRKKFPQAEELEEEYLKKMCYKTIDRILQEGEIKRQDLLQALGIRLGIDPNNVYLKNMDATMLNKALKELELML